MSALGDLGNLLATYARPRALAYLIFFVTARCDSRCRTCFYWREIDDADATGELTPGEADRIAASLDRLLYLSLSGGEPFLREDLAELCHPFAQRAGVRFVTIPTGGLHPDRTVGLTAEVLRACPESTVEIELSIDGLEKRQDEIRGVPGAFDRMRETYAGLERLERDHPRLKLKLNCTFSALNQDHIEELLEAAPRLFPRAPFSLSMVHGTPREAGAADVDLERYRALARRLEEGPTPQGMIRRLLHAAKLQLREDVLAASTSDTLPSPCLALRRFAVLDPYGKVYPCEPIQEPVGDLRESGYDLPSILESDRARSLIESHGIGSTCRCAWGCGLLNNLLFDPRRIPELLKRTL